MCGIVGYVGDPDRTIEILLDGLSRLEYRGYDSAGIAVIDGAKPKVVRSEGKLSNLKQKIEAEPLEGFLGIGHTRWATHGSAIERNAHPHSSGSVSVVHNGIIENFLELKDELIQNGYEFSSDTDTEVIAHLIEHNSSNGTTFEDAVRESFNRIHGSYAVAAISADEPDKVIATRKFSPLILAVGDGANYLASDIPAILPYTNKVIFLEDGDIAVIEKDSIKITDAEGKEAVRDVNVINWDPISVEKGGYRHFMLKEIHEQPQAILDTLGGRFDEATGEVFLEGIDTEFLEDIQRLILVACGTSYHACLIGKYMIEQVAGLPVEVDLASEFRYRSPILDDGVLVVAVSQSGETADTSEALIEAKAGGARTLGITNVMMSKIAREADRVIHTHAGPEIGVASTKAFTTQLIVFYLLAIYLGRANVNIESGEAKSLIHDLIQIPQIMQRSLKLEPVMKDLAKEFYDYTNFLYLGRGINYPVAYEGALKLKEISYIHAEGYAAGEMKHGPIALVDEHMPVVVLAPNGDVTYKKLLGNLQEVRARKGKVIFISSQKHTDELDQWVDRFIELPKSSYLLSPIVSVVPLQLLAYYIAVFKGTDIDQPRNLAKVVTVE